MKHTLESLVELAKTSEGKQQIRVMVAELCGWTKCRTNKNPLFEFGRKPGGKFPDFYLPDYTGSLDAIAEAEKLVQSIEEKNFYINTLNEIATASLEYTDQQPEVDWLWCTASALQRAIAFILTKQTDTP